MIKLLITDSKWLCFVFSKMMKCPNVQLAWSWMYADVLIISSILRLMFVDHQWEKFKYIYANAICVNNNFMCSSAFFSNNGWTLFNFNQQWQTDVNEALNLSIVSKSFSVRIPNRIAIHESRMHLNWQQWQCETSYVLTVVFICFRHFFMVRLFSKSCHCQCH